MNIKQELEEMQEELIDMEDEAVELSSQLSNAWWTIFSKIKELD